MNKPKLDGFLTYIVFWIFLGGCILQIIIETDLVHSEFLVKNFDPKFWTIIVGIFVIIFQNDHIRWKIL